MGPRLVQHGAKGFRIADHARGHDLSVDIQSADARVQVEELFEGYLAFVERLEAVLYADVVKRIARIAALRILAEDVDQIVLERAAHAFLLQHRIVGDRIVHGRVTEEIGRAHV